jgi:branched-chain amino acid transport system ATP-binding protein
MTPALEVRGLRAGYGSATVVRDLDLTVGPGEVLALLGPNGAGKTTTLLALAGLLDRRAGTVAVDGAALASGDAHAANRAGLVLVPDDRALFPSLTVRENVEAARSKRSPSALDTIAAFPALVERRDVPAGNLSGGEQQMLAMARAFVQEPRVLLVDELSMGLAPLVVTDLLAAVRGAADRRGMAVVLVEQHTRLALASADRAVVLVHGDVALAGTAAELAADPERLERAYLGAAATPEG